MLEMKSIFQLFDIDNNQEIDIKQINQLLRGLETLSI
jgi:Ca2+-binding EF-hand superfamily protein